MTACNKNVFEAEFIAHTGVSEEYADSLWYTLTDKCKTDPDPIGLAVYMAKEFNNRQKNCVDNQP